MPNKDMLNIQSIKAYIVNISKKEELKASFKNKTRFIGRFPIEPFTDEYLPTAHDINGCGYYAYYARPVSFYNGFGLKPDWKRIYSNPWDNVTDYLALVERTEQRDAVDVIFPAEAQLSVGNYKVVLVAKIYSPGYSVDNTRTVTADYNNVFELVSSTEEADSTTSTFIVSDGLSEGSDFYVNPEDIYVQQGSYNPGTITLNLTNGQQVPVDLSQLDSWYEGQ